MEDSWDEMEPSLADQIASRLIPSLFENDLREFVPEGDLNPIITKAAIEEELKDFANGSGFEELVRFICNHATKIFAIAVLSDIEGSVLYKVMKWFLAHGRFDEHLPLQPWKEMHELRSGRGRGWTPSRYRRFYENQWPFLAPIFRTDTENESNRDFEQFRILPFTKGETTERPHSGSFGKILKYKIHPNHLIDHEYPYRGDERYLAVKKMKPADEQDRREIANAWEREAHLLQKINALRQPNIVRFITAFSYGDKDKKNHYFMFEWADRGDLRDLWRTLPRDRLTPMLVKDAFKQMLGLATALCRAHYPTSGLKFLHGRLKPENILWFKPEYSDLDMIGTLKIAGWTELRNAKALLASASTNSYDPPEEDIGISTLSLNPAQPLHLGRRRTRLYDVWAMGCIMLEFIVWLRYGWDELIAFNDEIKGPSGGAEYPACFYTTWVVNGKRVALVHEAAIRWMDRMAADPAFPPGVTALGSLLQLVRDRLLVVTLPGALGATYAPASGSPSRSRESSRSRKTTPLQTANLEATASQDITIPDNTISRPENWAEDHRISQHRRKCRAHSYELVSYLEEIVVDGKEDSYWWSTTVTNPTTNKATYPNQSDSDSDEQDLNIEDETEAATNLLESEARFLTGPRLTGPFDMRENLPNRLFGRHHSKHPLPSYAESAKSGAGSESTAFTNPRYAESILSTRSAISSASSQPLDYVGVVKKEVVNILLSDDEIQDLVKTALNDPNIRSRRFTRNFRRLLKDFAKDLLGHSSSPVHERAAKLIRRESSSIANSVQSCAGGPSSLFPLPEEDEDLEATRQRAVEEYVKSQGREEEEEKQLWDARDDAWRRGQADSVGSSSSSDSDYDGAEDSKSITAVLDQVNEFLRSGAPLANFKSRLRSFVSPKIEKGGEGPSGIYSQAMKVIQEEKEEPSTVHDSTQVEGPAAAGAKACGTKPDAEIEDGRTQTSREPESSPFETQQGDGQMWAEAATYPATLPEFLDSILCEMPFWRSIFDKIPSLYPEPPIPPGHSRVRWTCECGARLFDDVVELEPGALVKLQESLRVSSHHEDSSGTGQRSSTHTGSWSFNGLFGWMKQKAGQISGRGGGGGGSGLPFVAPTTSTNASAAIPLGLHRVLHILFSVSIGENGSKLHQERLKGVSSDKELFLFLRREYRKRRKVSSWLTFRSVKLISLTKFDVDTGGMAQVRHHIPYCGPDCACLPPPNQVTGGIYSCDPAPVIKPEHVPVILPQQFTHHYQHPERLPSNQKVYLNQLPKRACGQLSYLEDQFVEGWGVCFQEGWHWTSIYFVIVVLLVIGSLVFGITWSATTGDIQSGFSVASYWMTLSTVLLGYIAVRSL